MKLSRPAIGKEGSESQAEERYFTATQWQLMWRKFRKHKVAKIGGIVLLLFYGVAIFAGFASVFDPNRQNTDSIYAPPQRIRITHEGKVTFRPFIYGLSLSQDPDTWRRIYTVDKTQVYPIRFFVRGYEYRLLGILRSDVHLFGTDGGPLYLLGTDSLGRDLYSRNIHAAKISLSVGLIGVVLSFVIGCIIGGISGYFGGSIDMLIQRSIEFLVSIPKIPLWMALSAALPPDWSSIKTYFAITILLSIVGWTSLARVVRGKLISLKHEEFIMAARITGTRTRRIITRHLLPNVMSYLLVSITLQIPAMILGETALSFLGLGIKEPAVSWGVLLKNAQNIRSVALTPWLLIPGIFIVVVVLCFSFVGDGLRDAADPYT